MNRKLYLASLLLGLVTAIQVAAQSPTAVERASARAPGDGYGAETLRSYTQRVQPLLLNSCGTGACHGGPNHGGFELVRGGLVQGLNANLTRQNLKQVLRLVDREEQSSSPLLHKALEAHGGARQPPMLRKDAPAYQTLATWVAQVAQETPAATRKPTTGLGAGPFNGETSLPKAASTGRSQFASLDEDGHVSPKVATESPAKIVETPVEKPAENDAPEKGATKKPTKVAAPEPVDPFDPAVFNWQKHRVAKRP